MRKFVYISMVGFSLLLSGCASQVMKSAQNQTLPALDSSKSRIVFMRSALHGTVVAAGMYEIKNEAPQIIGVLANNNKFSYDVVPGEHDFMSIGAGVRFLNGNFEAGKTYYIAAAPRGWPAINFALYPFRGDGNGKFNLKSPEFTSISMDAVLVEFNPEVEAWAENMKERVKSVFDKEWPLWKNKPDDFKAPFTVRTDDGV